MSDTATELIETLARLANGDAVAREQLLAHTHVRFQALARRMLHGGLARVVPFEKTGDVMQTLFLRLLKGWEKVVRDEHGAP